MLYCTFPILLHIVSSSGNGKCNCDCVSCAALAQQPLRSDAFPSANANVFSRSKCLATASESRNQTSDNSAGGEKMRGQFNCETSQQKKNKLKLN